MSLWLAICAGHGGRSCERRTRRTGECSCTCFRAEVLKLFEDVPSPLHGLNTSHLTAAMEVLLNGFAHVSVLEDEGACHGHVELVGLLGGGVAAGSGGSDALPKTNSYAEARCAPTWPPALAAALCDANALDIALYAIFKQPAQPANGGCSGKAHGGAAHRPPHGWVAVQERVCTSGEAAWLAHCRQVAGKACAERSGTGSACGVAWDVLCGAR